MMSRKSSFQQESDETCRIVKVVRFFPLEVPKRVSWVADVVVQTGTMQ